MDMHMHMDMHMDMDMHMVRILLAIKKIIQACIAAIYIMPEIYAAILIDPGGPVYQVNRNGNGQAYFLIGRQVDIR